MDNKQIIKANWPRWLDSLTKNAIFKFTSEQPKSSDLGIPPFLSLAKVERKCKLLKLVAADIVEKDWHNSLLWQGCATDRMSTFFLNKAEISAIKEVVKEGADYGQQMKARAKCYYWPFQVQTLPSFSFLSGHLRSTVIGDALSNIFSAKWATIPSKSNHLGEIPGLLMVAYKNGEGAAKPILLTNCYNSMSVSVCRNRKRPCLGWRRTFVV